MQLWKQLAEGGVLLAPGWYFSADQENIPDSNCEGHYRISFSTATVRVCVYRYFRRLTCISQFSDMKRGIDIIAKVMKSFLDGNH